MGSYKLGQSRRVVKVEELKEIIIPGTVKEIGKNAFSYNTEIEKITIEDGVLSIGQNAFRACTSLKEVIMPDSIISMEGEAFRGCTNIEKVQLSNNLTTIKGWTFTGCSKLTMINMPNSLKSIGEYSFSNCTNLNNITIPAGVNSIGLSAFRNCTNLYNLTIEEGNSTYEVEDGIIYKKDNSELIMLAQMATEKTITIREGIKTLGVSALTICKSMTTLELPRSLKSIVGQAFEGLTLLETIRFPNGSNNYKVEDGYLYNKAEDKLIYIVQTKAKINIKNTVKSIENYAIQGQNVTEVIIPDNVTTINANIFTNAYNADAKIRGEEKLPVVIGKEHVKMLDGYMSGVRQKIPLYYKEARQKYKPDEFITEIIKRSKDYQTREDKTIQQDEIKRLRKFYMDRLRDFESDDIGVIAKAQELLKETLEKFGEKTVKPE